MPNAFLNHYKSNNKNHSTSDHCINHQHVRWFQCVEKFIPKIFCCWNWQWTWRTARHRSLRFISALQGGETKQEQRVHWIWCDFQKGMFLNAIELELFNANVNLKDWQDLDPVPIPPFLRIWYILTHMTLFLSKLHSFQQWTVIEILHELWDHNWAKLDVYMYP